MGDSSVYYFFGCQYGTIRDAFITNFHPSFHPSPPVPDVLPDASNSTTLLIKLGLTFKKVC